jgi:hypothetical protein
MKLGCGNAFHVAVRRLRLSGGGGTCFTRHAFADADALAFVLRQGWFANANVEALGVDVLCDIQPATFGATQRHRRSR